MTRSPLVATAALILVVVGIPAAVIQRVSAGLLPLQSADLLLGIVMVIWALVCKAVIDRRAPIDSVAGHRLSPSWQAHNLVEQSLLGVGFTGRAQSRDNNDGLARVSQITELASDQLPPLSQVLGQEAVHPMAVPARTSIALLEPEDEPDLEMGPTEEYIVGRGDTFWSIADSVLGDGRLWKQVQRLNLNREVVADVFLREGDELRIGWSVLIPVAARAEGTDHEVG